jgi:hypothetical protein
MPHPPLPDEVTAVRFARPVAVGPKGTPSSETQDSAKDTTLAIRLEKGCVVLFRVVEGKRHTKAWPLSGGAVVDLEWAPVTVETAGTMAGVPYTTDAAVRVFRGEEVMFPPPPLPRPASPAPIPSGASVEDVVRGWHEDGRLRRESVPQSGVYVDAPKAQTTPQGEPPLAPEARDMERTDYKAPPAQDVAETPTKPPASPPDERRKPRKGGGK